MRAIVSFSSSTLRHTQETIWRTKKHRIEEELRNQFKEVNHKK